MRIGIKAVILVVAASVGIRSIAASRPVAQRSGRVESLIWLTGCWARSTSRGLTEEQWTRPAGGTMLGMSRTVQKGAERDSTTEFEFLRLFARNGKLVYAALPSGQQYTEFVETESTDSSIVLGNPSHDFPQFIRYARRGADSVVARIEGTIQGRARTIDFRYARAKCG